MSAQRAGTVVTAALLLGCGPETVDLGDVYPRNCGREGPVDLFELEPMSFAELSRAGDHYLVRHFVDHVELEHWAVDRCGEERVLLQAAALRPSPTLGVAGDYVLSCDEATGAMAYVDPTGVEPPRVLFPAAVEGCRVVPVGKGLAAQQEQGGTVWFHPDPTDPDVQALVVTEAARLPYPADSPGCHSPQLDCEGSDAHGLDIRAAGDDLLVVLENEALLAFSSTTVTSRTLDGGPVSALDVLPEGRLVVVRSDMGPTLIVDRRTGTSFEFCCWSEYEPIRQLGDWLVHGSGGPPYVPEPPEWTNFWAYHLPSGKRTEITGTEDWSVLARLTADTVIATIGPYGELEGRRAYAVWPETGERQPLDLPLDARIWTLPGRDGVYALLGDEPPYVVLYLAGPGATPRVLLEDVRTLLPTFDGRIVFDRAGAPGEPTPLAVMRSDQRVVEIEARALGMDTSVYVQPFAPRPEDTDEALYVVEDAGQWVVRRTVLP